MIDRDGDRFTDDFDEVELRTPDFITVFKLIWHSIRGLFHHRPAQIIGSTFLLIMVWGYHGELELLRKVWPQYRGPGKDLGARPELLPGIPWDNELISFWGGAFLLVVVPGLLIVFLFKQRLSEYGLGLPPEGRRMLALWICLTFTILSLPAFYLAAHNQEMREVYPFFHPFTNTFEFALYELTYLPFFVAIEFIFRGYLLFGLSRARDSDAAHAAAEMPSWLYLGRYALVIQMLPYTAWHLGKPTPELWGTIIWGLAAGAAAYATRSIWPVVLSHWLLNVFLDYVIFYEQ